MHPSIASRLAAADSRALGRALAYLLLTRLPVAIVAASAVRLLAVGLQPGAEAYFPGSLSLGAWLRWDAWWYLSVAERGYHLGPELQSNVAFFPLFPLAVRGVAAVTGNTAVAGFVVANVAALAGVIALWAWARLEGGTGAADRAVRWLAVFPFAFFLHTVYAESLFLALVALSFLAARRERWPLAGLWGALAALTRPFGVLLWPAYAWSLALAWRDGRRPRGRDVAALTAIPAGLGAFMLHLAVTVGDPLAFWHAHRQGWHVTELAQLAPYRRGLRVLVLRGWRLQSYMQLLDVLSVLLPVAFAVLAVVAYRRLGAAAGVFTALVVAVTALLAPESAGRELLAAVPAFVVLGLVDGGGGLGEGLRMVAFGAMLLLLVAFVTGHFVG